MKSCLTIIFIFSISTAYGLEKMRQCTCNEQHKCFESMKDEVAECLDECVDRAGLENIIFNDTAKLAPCMEMRKKIIFDFNDCMDNQCSMKQSCAPNMGNQLVEFRDFEGIYLKFVRPILDKIETQLEELSSGMNIPFVKTSLGIQKCWHDCALRKLQNLQCFNRQKCTLKIQDELVVKSSMDQCVQQIGGLKQRYFKICQCFVQTGANDVMPFCEKIQNAEILEKF